MDIVKSLSQIIADNALSITALLTQKDLIKELGIKLAGPTFDYVGEGIKNSIEKKFKNISNIMIKGTKKLGDKIYTDGQVNPRILKEIIEEGSYVEEEIVAEYFSGILVSSRCIEGKDDRGLFMLSLLKGMSACDILIHCILYKTIKEEYNNSKYQIGDPKDRIKMKTFIPYVELVNSLKSIKLNCEYETVIVDTMFILSQYDLIDSEWLLSPKENIEKQTKGKANQDGLWFTPSALGARLMLWAYGYGSTSNKNFFALNIIFEDDQNIKAINNAIKLGE